MDNELVKSLYEQYKTGLFRYILSIIHDAHLAEDILQDTFVQLMVKDVHLEQGKEQAWLYKVARNRCFNVLKQSKDIQNLPISDSYEDELAWEYLDLISHLSQKEQEIVTLRIVAGFSHKEIAKIVGATVHATKKRYERAILKLRVEMEKSI